MERKKETIFNSLVQSLKYDNNKKEAIESDLNMKFGVAIIMCVASLVLTILNIVKESWFMMWTTIVLTVGFAIGALLCKLWKKRDAAAILMGALVTVVFSVYAITGENDGFAILWILIVPPIGMSILNFKVGTVIGIYFQIFLMVIFYTPIRDNLVDYYSSTFMLRFPLLYLTSFAAAILITAQKQFYYKKADDMSNKDTLTDLHNRKYYETCKQEISQSHNIEGLTIISVDVNSLKYTNDNLGHQAGDELIIGAAQCLSKAFDNAKAVCRIGGDEFAILTFASPAEVIRQMQKLNELLDNWKGHYVFAITLSIGVADNSSNPNDTIDELEKKADKAMYTNKERYYTSNGRDRRVSVR